ncbi:protein kinase [Azoarcus communis]|uniref:Serine/threonine protein kinase n=1 Tax=Parazoarcus communis SWub3 = DSM 12120 TaxID=1121029 RepID=A0A323UUE1_9RHOO|nr:serine/threonine-protein kinase [Parazoarcus communis]NMG50534.1 protein kinase [Parazoarcus communis]NMG72241.1 protein kinase [Parazoarcus communis SWub3 = DSM 12120]PZA14826.1 serine/threonine protein kinase [Azoarcus communis] [Parazoarcus communis SWub3 = DSM 12120]
MATNRIGKYEIRRLLGEGATSAVFLAWDPFRQRDVAIKQLFPEVVSDQQRGRLYRQLLLNEAALAGKLAHPHIVQIYDAVISDNDAYVVMEYVPGGTLEPLTRPGQLLPFERLIEIIFKCTRALDYAFHQGITHRDIKPANILLTAAGGSDIRISDFGAALQTASDTTQITGIGSPAYMSPQQVREMPLDHRTDIYSLGVVMYQLLTSRLPFEADNNYGLIYRIAHETPVPPIDLRPEIPLALDAIVRRAMEKELDRRYQSWAEFSHDLALAFRNRSVALDRHALPEAEKFQTLRSIAFFREFADAELWEVITLAQWSHLKPGTVIMKEGEAGDHFCFLANGEAQVKKRGKLLNILTAGECFGEMALFSAGGGIRSASVEANTEVDVITIRARALQRASDTCRMHFYKAFLEVLSTRLSLASARIANL